MWREQVTGFTGRHGLERVSGGLVDLAATYSPTSWDAVPWALRGFTAEFGMGSGGAPALSATRSTDHPLCPHLAGRAGEGAVAGQVLAWAVGPWSGDAVVADGGRGRSSD